MKKQFEVEAPDEVEAHDGVEVKDTVSSMAFSITSTSTNYLGVVRENTTTPITPNKALFLVLLWGVCVISRVCDTP